MKTEQDITKVADGIKPQLLQLLQTATKENVMIKLVLNENGWQLEIDDYLNDVEYNGHIFNYLAERKASTTYHMSIQRCEEPAPPQFYNMTEDDGYLDDEDDDTLDIEFLSGFKEVYS